MKIYWKLWIHGYYAFVSTMKKAGLSCGNCVLKRARGGRRSQKNKFMFACKEMQVGEVDMYGQKLLGTSVRLDFGL